MIPGPAAADWVLVVDPEAVPAQAPDPAWWTAAASPWLVVPRWLLDGRGIPVPDPASGAVRDLLGPRARRARLLPAVRAASGGAVLAALAGGEPGLDERLAEGLAAEPEAAGLCLDLGGDFAAARDEFGALVERLSWHLRRERRILAVAVDAQVREPGPDEPGPPYDYRVLGVYADLLLVRGFGYRGDAPPPHPTSPAGWLQSVLEHALSLVPARSLVLCLPLFGYLWRVGAPRGEPLPLRRAEALPGRRRRDAAAAAVQIAGADAAGPFEAWVDDAESLAEKAALAQRWLAGGVGFWGLGGEPGGLPGRLAAGAGRAG